MEALDPITHKLLKDVLYKLDAQNQALLNLNKLLLDIKKILEKK